MRLRTARTIKFNKKLKIVSVLLATLALQLSVPFMYPQKSEAADLTEASIMLYRMGASVANSATNPLLVVLKPASTATEASVKVTLTDATASGFTINATASNITTSIGGVFPSTFQGESITGVTVTNSQAASVTDNGNTTDITFATNDLTPGTLYGFLITGGITNPSGAGTQTGTITTQTSAPAAIDTKGVAMDVTTASGDQVIVTASVPATFNFALSANTLALGTLSTGSITSGNVTVDIDTNAGNGWVAFIRGSGSAVLSSASTGDSISSTATGSPVTVVAGAKGYVVDVAGSQGGSSGGSLTIATEYDGNGTSTGGVIATTYEQIAQSTGVALNDTLTLTALVTISAVTKAANDYTNTWDVVGAANF